MHAVHFKKLEFTDGAEACASMVFDGGKEMVSGGPVFAPDALPTDERDAATDSEDGDSDAVSLASVADSVLED